MTLTHVMASGVQDRTVSVRPCQYFRVDAVSYVGAGLEWETTSVKYVLHVKQEGRRLDLNLYLGLSFSEEVHLSFP